MRFKTVSLNRQLVILTLTRWLDSIAYRMVYPFLPVFARGLGIGIENITLAISVRSAFGILGPLLGHISDLRGRRTALLYGLSFLTVGLGLITIWPTFPIFFSGLLLSTIGGIIIEATIHAYLGDQVPFQRRGRVIAIVELGWSASFILGIPVIGWIISRGGWSSPFIWLAFVGLVCIVLVWRILPSSTPAFQEKPSIFSGLLSIFTQPQTAIALVFGLFVVTANQLVTIIFGVWMEDAFHLHVAELGLASSIIGVSEIMGTVLVALFTDRLGIRRATCLGLFINSVACLLIPATKTNLIAALVILFFFYLSFEFSITSSIPLMTELVPAARATFLATNITAYALADSLGAIIGPILYKNGILWNGLLAIVLNVTGMGLLLLVFHVRKSAVTLQGRSDSPE